MGKSCARHWSAPTEVGESRVSLELPRPGTRSQLVHSSLSPVEFGRAPPLEDSRAEGMCPNWYKPISMEIYQSITSSPTVSTVLVTPMTPSKPCILVVVSELSFDTDLHSYYKTTQHHTVSSNGI